MYLELLRFKFFINDDKLSGFLCVAVSPLFYIFFYFKECSVLGDIDSDSDMRLFNKEDFNKCDDTKLNQVEYHCEFNYTRFSVFDCYT